MALGVTHAPPSTEKGENIMNSDELKRHKKEERSPR
jgi:hypothetical protein